MNNEDMKKMYKSIVFNPYTADNGQSFRLAIKVQTNILGLKTEIYFNLHPYQLEQLIEALQLKENHKITVGLRLPQDEG